MNAIHFPQGNTISKGKYWEQASLEGRFKCSRPNCIAAFAEERSLKLHVRKHHHNFGRKWKCPLCPYTARQRTNDIHRHFEKNHDIPLRKEHHVFKSREEFISWKCEMEKTSVSTYRKRSSKENYLYYQCHRCGFYNSEGRGKRHIKISGTCKINGYCPANLTVKIKNDTLHVTHVVTHVGHKNEIKHKKLSSEERRLIALQLADKKPHEEILKNIRESISNYQLQRIHLTNKKDIVNIEKSFNLHHESVKHPFDPVSISSWVKEMKNSTTIAHVSFKPQGVKDPQYPDLQENDFLLIFITNAQKAMLQKFGADTICIDGTHGLNTYDFQLFTLLTLDETREGFPSAFMFSNKADISVMKIFFDCIKSTAGVIKPKVFMSDMDATFYSSWNQVMGQVENRLYCSWHVLKAWRRKLGEAIKTKEKREYVQKILQTLMYELDIDTFHRLLEGFLSTLKADDVFHDFLEYFSKNYLSVGQYKSWAYCYRVHAGINTNMSLESFNRVLKYCYLKGKKVRRLDKTLCAILNLMRDKIFDLLIKMLRGKLVRKLQTLRKCHKRSLTVGNNQIMVNENKWLVTSSTQTEFYTVKRVRQCKTCQLQCFSCNSCFHEFVCNCIESAIRNNMCKHIHAVATMVHRVQEEHNYMRCDGTKNEGSIHRDLENDENQLELLNEVSRPTDKNLAIEKKIAKAMEDIATITHNVTSLDVASYFEREITRIKTNIEAMNEQSIHTSTLQVKGVLPNGNEKFEQQRKFFRAKKRTMAKKIHKISTEERNALALQLLSTKDAVG
ncbi:uncharacterized protein LOC128994741 [Macrosteles quadrilineatus]|uniref:uncharacterized protein LOC128994741 n=1 Tax=Macrosteles quadrilineatus TaxID=74068 RepID=UPI0023E1D257|nr:uncharacterized protein LOC128994741 [Macrosteles quadrilineatus]